MLHNHVLDAYCNRLIIINEHTCLRDIKQINRSGAQVGYSDFSKEHSLDKCWCLQGQVVRLGDVWWHGLWCNSRRFDVNGSCFIHFTPPQSSIMLQRRENNSSALSQCKSRGHSRNSAKNVHKFYSICFLRSILSGKLIKNLNYLALPRLLWKFWYFN